MAKITVPGCGTATRGLWIDVPMVSHLSYPTLLASSHLYSSTSLGRVGGATQKHLTINNHIPPGLTSPSELTLLYTCITLLSWS